MWFEDDTKDHKMEVVRDDGLYRHLKFRGKDGICWFDLVTWPHVLTIHGDCGTFVFTRIEDMFQFFRGPTINPSYWSEKVVAEDRYGGTGTERFLWCLHAIRWGIEQYDKHMGGRSHELVEALESARTAQRKIESYMRSVVAATIEKLEKGKADEQAS